MDLRSELLKSIWYGFTALDLEKSGKVSKSQLKVSEGSSTWKMELEKLFFPARELTHLLPFTLVSYLVAFYIMRVGCEGGESNFSNKAN